MSARIASRLAWACAALTVALIVLGAVLVAVTPPQSLPPDLRRSPSWFDLLKPLYAIAFSIVGALIVSRRPENRVGWVCCAIGLLSAFSFFTPPYAGYALFAKPGSLPGAEWLVWMQSWDFSLTFALMVVFLPLLFPNGRLPSPRWRLVAWLAAISIVLQLSAAVLGAGRAQGVPLSHFRNPLGIYVPVAFLSRLISLAGLVSIPAYLLGPLSVIVRFRRAGPEERQQLKWVTAAVALMLIIISAAIVIGVFILHTIPIQVPVLDVLVPLSLISLPIAIGVAILKYRLYDIDLVITKSLVFGALAAFITAVYVAIVVGLGVLVGTRGQPNLALSILATAVVAVAFQPVRERVQGFANRLVYGKRASPYEVLAQFSERVAGAYSSDEILPRMARVLAEGTGAARSDVWIRIGPDLVPTTSWPQGDGAQRRAIPVTSQLLPAVPGVDRAVAVKHQGELLGALTINKRAGEALTPVEEKLLTDLASQAGLVLRNVRLTAELQARLQEISKQAAELRASRQRIVAAQDAERRRLERNIHDGAQQNLVALPVKLRLASTFAKRNPDRAHELVRELKAET